ncbi:hypothetical protein ACQPZK_23485 [Micromonospora sp. CA-249363]|uniref:hypothetical protein n=1 Tax=Micromonospora sp. CA-249363 TaxID=3239963 RepID=UPI003D8E1316
MESSDLISAKEFAHHTSVWRQCAPMLDRVARWLNTQQVSLGRAVVNTSAPQRNALLAETAFLTAASVYDSTGLTGRHAAQAARTALQFLPRGEFARADLDYEELSEVEKLSDKILRFAEGLPSASFSPQIPGCGVVARCTGDMASPSQLIEIKTVTRPFRGTDLRQLLTYTAMLYAKGEAIDNVTLLNPRRARYVTVSVEMLAQGSSGKAKAEIMQDLIDAMVTLQVSA